MDEQSEQKRATELLQQLGLTEYDARCFVALTRLPQGTAKEVSEVSEVPRTRVYDAVSVLETKGLVETKHTSPRQFRAVPVDEAVETLRAEYESRVAALREALSGVGTATADETAVTHEVWALSGDGGIAARCITMIEDADEEVMLVVTSEQTVDADLVEALAAAVDRGVSVVVGATTDGARSRVATALPGAEVFRSGLGWLEGAGTADDDTEIGRLTLVDRSAILMSTHRGGPERAVFGTGFENGLVVVVRRLLAAGLFATDGSGD